MLPVFRALHKLFPSRAQNLLKKHGPAMDGSVRSKVARICGEPADPSTPGFGWTTLCLECDGKGCPKC